MMAPFMDATRPADSMPLSMDSPSEDEIATLQLSGGKSPYMQLIFMRKEHQYRSYFDFCSAEHFQAKSEWVRGFQKFLHKVTYRCGGDKPLLLKSTAHTGRVRNLMKMFPKARFVYIHRDPYELFQSTAHMADTYLWHCALQVPTNEQVTEYILWLYEFLHDVYVKERTLIPENQLHELSFHDLEKDPIGQVEKIYTALRLGGFEDVLPLLQSYTKSTSGYKKNVFASLAPETIELINKRWGRTLSTFGYTMRH